MDFKRRQFVITAIAACVPVHTVWAQTPVNTAYAQLATSQSAHAPASNAVQPTAYFAPPRLEPSPSTAQTAPPSSPLPAAAAAPTSGYTIIPPSNSISSPNQSSSGFGDPVVTPPSDSWCLPPQPPPRTSSWSIAAEIIPTDSFVPRADFGSWTDDSGLAGRVIVGYEDPRGLGVRARVWGEEQDVEAYSDDVTLSASAIDFDLYRRFFIDDSELVLGGGASGRGLKFDQPGNGYSRFRGDGPKHVC